MNGFKKLVLASAVLAASSSAFAMEAMDDESMSSTTGQDGLTITLDSTINDLAITYVDRDGYGVSGFTEAGAVVIGSAAAGIDLNLVDVVVTIDAGGSAGTASGSGMLNINVGMATSTIGLGNVVIGVADASNTTGSSSVGAVVGILSFDASAALTIAGNANLMNIQLGNEDQGAMIRATANLGNVTLTGLSINDTSVGGGSISIGVLELNNVQLDASIDVVAGGLQIVSNSSIGEVGMERVVLGGGSAIGDIYITGLGGVGESSTILVTGH
jgi:hypothetical protein